MFCPSCGTEIPDNSQICPSCKAQIVFQATQSTAPLPTNLAYPASVGQTQTLPLNNGGVAQSAEGVPAQTTTPFYPAYPANTTSAGYTNPTPVPMAPVAPIAPAKKSKAPLVILLILVAAVVAGLVGFGALKTCSVPGVASGPEDVVQRAARTALNLDFESMLDTVPPEMLAYGLARAGYSDKSELVDYLNGAVAELDSQTGAFGIDVRSILKLINVDTRDVSYYSADGLETLKSTWNERIAGFGDSFEDAATVTVDISGEIELFGQKLSFADYIGSASQDVTVVKIDGQWYLLESDFSELANLL